MFVLNLKYHIRNSTAYLPVALVALLVVVGLLVGFNMAVLAPILLSKSYYRIYDHSPASLRLLRITKCRVSGVMLCANMAMLLFMVLGFCVGLLLFGAMRLSLPKIMAAAPVAQMPFWALQLVVASLICSAAGNAVANSNLITLHGALVKGLMPKLAFQLFGCAGVAAVFFLSLFPWPATLLLGAAVAAVWLVGTRRYDQIKYIEEHLPL